jgi:hypothetical protein
VTSFSSQNSNSSSLDSIFLRIGRRLIAAVEGYFADLTENHYSDGVMALEYRWKKCIGIKEHYVKK